MKSKIEKGFRGYIFSRPFMEERVPQHVQNIVIRDYCSKQGIQYLLSATEYTMENSALMLRQLVKDLSSIDGIVAYSIFQLPFSDLKRNKIFYSDDLDFIKIWHPFSPSFQKRSHSLIFFYYSK